MFRFLVLSFFISNIMTVLGSVMDGFALSNAMDEGTVAAVSYYAGAAVLVWYFCRKSLVRLVFKGSTFREMISVNRIGLAAGIISVWYSLTLMAKAEIINMGIAVFYAESIGLQAYNVTVQVNYLINALMSSAVSAMFLLAGMFSA